MTLQTKADKWNKIYEGSEHDAVHAAKVLEENLHLLPISGNALDLACGLGGNAILLAQQGLETSAWDISRIAIDKLQAYSENLSIPIQLEARDVTVTPPTANSFDIIVVTRFLDRTLIPHLIDALREGGLIFYQAFIKDKTGDTGPKNPDYRLAENELLSLFQALQIICYREEGTVGDLKRGFRNEAMLIARKG
ncbi:MAG: methyltransferase domain-containing protein [Gammaproteobacteria bacterium]|jgi:tellurite methyltransferase|nr:methyltransferase domain-containing protein [Gammaproteobacteria bacterium]